MIENTDNLSLWGYGFFIVITLVGFISIFILIKSNSISPEKEKTISELFKWMILTVGITCVGYFVTDSFKERQFDREEMTTFNYYIPYVVTDTILMESRIQLAAFFSTVTPSGPLQRAWEKWYEKLQNDKSRTDSINKSQIQVGQNDGLTPKQQAEEMQTLEEDRQKILKSNYSSDLSTYLVVVAADETLLEAKDEVKKLPKSLNALIFQKGKWYCTVIPNLKSYSEAENVRDELSNRDESKKDEYIVPSNAWCKNPKTDKSNEFKICD